MKITEYKKGTLLINKVKEIYFGGLSNPAYYNPGSWEPASFVILGNRVKGIERSVLVCVLTTGKVAWLYDYEVDNLLKREDSLVIEPVEEK